MTPIEKAKAARLSFENADTQTESERRDVEALEKAAGVVYCYPYGHKPSKESAGAPRDKGVSCTLIEEKGPSKFFVRVWRYDSTLKAPTGSGRVEAGPFETWEAADLERHRIEVRSQPNE